MRPNNTITITIGFIVTILGAAVAWPADNGALPAEFEKLHKELTAAKEPWQTIPWQLSLLDARRLAVKDKKPIYMLCRSGHPLGCV